MRESSNVFYFNDNRYEFIEVYRNSFKTKELGIWNRDPVTGSVTIKIPCLCSYNQKYESIELFTFSYTDKEGFKWVNDFKLKEKKSFDILERMSKVIIQNEQEIFSEERVKADQLRNLFSA